MSLRVLVTGGTGFIGRHVAERLLADGHHVRCMARSPEKAVPLAARGVEVVPGDLGDPLLVREAARGMDVVVHAAAQVGEWGTRRRFEDANVAGTRAVLDAAEAASARRLVHLSSVAVYGRQTGAAIPESAPYHLTGDRYCDTKIAAEKVVWERHRAGAVRAVCVRPCIVYGPYDWKFVPKLAKAIRAGSFPLIGGGRHRAPVVSVRDVTDLVVRCLTHPAAEGEAFNCASPEPVTWREFTAEIARLVGASPPRRSVPFALAYGLGAVLETLYRAAGARKPPLVTRFGTSLLGLAMAYDISKAERLLGFRPQVLAAEGLAETIAWLQQARRHAAA